VNPTTIAPYLLDEFGEVALRKNGSPIRTILGAAEDDGGTDDGTGGDGTDDNGGNSGGGDDGKPAGTPSPARRKRIDEEDDPTVLRDEIKRLRGESKGYREGSATKAQQAAETARQAMLDDIAVKLGLKKGDDAPTVDSLQKQHQTDMSAKDEKIRSLTIKNSLGEAMAEAGARPVARDAIMGSGVLRNVDTESDTFEDDLAEAVEKYLEKHPELKAGEATEQVTKPKGKTGGDFQGNGNKDNEGPKSIDELRKERAARRANTA
jgi:hypothetical protein